MNTKTLLGAAGLVAAFALTVGASSTARASGPAGIMIDFNDYTANYWVYQQSRTTFAVPSTDNGTGQPVLCNGASWCWEYAQPTTDTESPANFYWFYVYDWDESTGTGNSHYHLGFEDPNMTCLGNTGFGRPVGSSCVEPSDYAAEPRVLYPHHTDAWVVTYPDAWREFNALSVWNRGTVPIQVWVLANDWNWYFLDNLGAGIAWDLTALPGPFGGYEIDIGAASSYTGGAPWSIDDLMIDYPPL